MTLDFSLDRTIEIRAARATVFRFFTDSARWARWWGAGSTVEPRVGGAVEIVYPGDVRVTGVVKELVPDERFVFTYGYERTSKPATDPQEAMRRTMPPGTSLVTITLSSAGPITRLELRHDIADAATRDDHVQGWRYQLARFAHVVGDDAYAAATDHVAAWVAAWNEPDAAKRRALLVNAVASDMRFRDAHGDVYGLDELLGHIGAVHQFMPGAHLEARGTLRRSHDTALADWAITAGDKTLMTGTNVIRFGSDAKIADVVGVG